MINFLTSSLSSSLRFFHWQLHCAHRLALRNSKIVLFLTFSLFAGSLFLGPKVKVGITTSDWLDHRLPSTQDYLQLKSLFPSEDQLIWIAPIGLQDPDLCRLQKDIDHWKLEVTALHKINSIFDLRRPILFPDNKLFYPLVLGADCQWQPADLEQVKNHPLHPGLLAGGKQNLVVGFSPHELDESSKYGSVDFGFLEQWTQKLDQEFPGGLFGGNLFFQLSIKKGIERAQILNLVTAIMLLLLTRLFVGRWIAGVLLVSLVLLTTLTLQSGMMLFQHRMDPMSSSLFVLMTIATLEDFYFLYYVAQSRGLSFIQSCRRLLLPSFFTSFTTAIGFGSLAFSENQSLQHLGVWTATGAMLEWVLLFMVLPCFAKTFSGLNQVGPLPNLIQMPWLRKIAHFCPSKKWTLVSLLPLLAVPWIYSFANINYSPFDMFKDSHPLNEFRRNIEQSFGYQGEISVVFNRDKLTAEDSFLLQKISALEAVSRIYDPEKIFSALVPLGSSDSLARLIYQDFSKTDSFEKYHAENRIRALVQIKNIDLQSVEKVTAQMRLICGDQCQVTGELAAFKDYAYSMLHSLFQSFFSSLIPVLLTLLGLCLATLKRPHWPLLISSLWGPCTLLILVIVFQIKINVVTCLAMALLIGLAGDNAIQFLLFSQRKSSVSSRQKDLSPASVLILIIMAAISSVLLLSYYKSAQILSGLMMVGVLCLLIGDIWILSGLSRPKSDDQSDSK